MQSFDTLNPEYQLGVVLKKRWKLTKVLGEGSFAVVFLAQDLLQPNQKAAVKCLYKLGLSKSQLILQREELVILQRVGDHPYITSLLDFEDTFDHLYMILEYCEIDLFDCIMKDILPEKKALSLFAQLVSAVATCHKVGIYHRDLKPENVLITKEGSPELRLSDFGLSTTERLSTEFGCGSVRYMAPECLSSNFNENTPYLSDANDVWSLAIILINMLTGKNPWVEPSEKDKHFKTHLLSPPQSVDTFRTQFNFSDEFCQVLRMVFCSGPENRPSASQFLAHVEKLPSLFHKSNLPSVLVPFSKRSQNSKKSVNAGILSPASFDGGFSCQLPPVSTPKPHFMALPPTPNSYADPCYLDTFHLEFREPSQSKTLGYPAGDHLMMFEMDHDELNFEFCK
jgi:serine/threonine protein kinase